MRLGMVGIPAAALLFAALFSLPVYAHGEWEQYLSAQNDAGAVIVGLSAAPPSPLAGETVGFVVSFREPHDKFTYRENIASLRYEIEAFSVSAFPNGGVIFRSEEIPTELGSAEFMHTFAEPGLYDIHIVFTDSGVKRSAGYLIQVRGSQGTTRGYLPLLLGTTLLVGITFGFLARHRS